MALSIENILLLGSVLMFISIVASKTSFRLGVPSLILFLVIGMLAGSDGPGGIYFNDPKAAQFLGVIALTFILFSGGLETKWESIRPVLKNGLALSTIGVLLTACMVGIFSSYLLDISWQEGMLLGAIVSSTDAAAVFSILRTRNIGLKGNVRPLLEFESGSNDPMAYFLTISFIYLLQNPEANWWNLVPNFLKGMTLGALAGYGFGRLMLWIVNRIRLDAEGLYPVLIMSLVLFTFSFTDFLGGNGFLAVYVSAIILGNNSFIHKKSLIKYYDGQAWLLQIVMFLTLGLLVFPREIVPVMGEGIILSAFLIFVARPAAVFTALAFARDLNFRKKLFISWVGLRGAVPIVFATYALLAQVPHATDMFNIVFFISVSSVLVQGTTLTRMAHWLHVSVAEKLRRRFPLDVEWKEGEKSELVEFDLNPYAPAVGKRIVELKLPADAIIVLIHRKDKYINASGSTVLESGDHLLVMIDNKTSLHKVTQAFGSLPHAL